MTDTQLTHATFTIERVYDATPDRVWQAFADAATKRKWFAPPPEWGPEVHTMEFRVGGRETSQGGPVGGPVIFFDSRFEDIVEHERIVTSYSMTVDGKRISVSLTTTTLVKEGKRTRMTFTEQGAYFGGPEDPKGREEGTAQMLDAIGKLFR
jgi:uncharacterized protein YndB with AHSA1/START domain